MDTVIAGLKTSFLLRTLPAETIARELLPLGQLLQQGNEGLPLGLLDPTAADGKGVGCGVVGTVELHDVGTRKTIVCLLVETFAIRVLGAKHCLGKGLAGAYIDLLALDLQALLALESIGLDLLLGEGGV